MPRQPSFTLSVGTLVGKSLVTYLRNFLPFTLLSAFVMSPWIAFRILVVEHSDARYMPTLSALFESLLTYVLTGALTYGVVMQLRGEPAGIAVAIAKGAQTFLRALGTGILCGIRIFLWSLLLWIPGIIEAVRLYVALPVAVMENKGGNEAIARSDRLTAGSRWQLFVSWFLAFILPIGASYLVTYLIVTAGVIPVSAFVWFEIGIALVFNAFAATLMAVCYFLLRQGKENVDAKTLAAVFD